MKMLAPFALVASFIAGGAFAATSEADYIAARDKGYAKIKSLEDAKAKDEKIAKEDAAVRADLEKRLRELIGDLSVKGFPAKGRLSLESLSGSDIGYGMLDGLIHMAGDEGELVFVSTRGLLKRWLKAKPEDAEAPTHFPKDPATAFKSDDFYVFAIGSDASFTRSATLNVPKPEGVDLVRADLGAWTQEISAVPPTDLMVAMFKGDKVYIADVRPKTAIKEIPACATIWKKAEKEAKRLDAAYEASKSKDAKLMEQRTEVETKGETEYRACWNERAPSEKFFAAAVKEAEALVNALAGAK